MSKLQACPEPTRMQHLPPAEAWNNPKKWLRFENGHAVGINPDTEKLLLPYDDRGFVIGSEAVRLVRALFRPGYVWRYDSSDPLTRPDIHYWYSPASDYNPEAHGGDRLAQRFRDLPPNLAYMQRYFHNTVHAVTYPPDMLAYEHMERRVEAYGQAHRLFSALIRSAKDTISTRTLFSMRQETLTQHPEMIDNDDYDEIGEQILQTMFARTFRGYRQALKQIQDAREQNQAIMEFGVVPDKASPTPDQVIRLLGRGAPALAAHETYVAELLSA